MSTIFPRSLRGLESDGVGHPTGRLLLVAVVLAPWVAWLLLARLSVYEVSQAGRLEVERIHPVAASVVGRVVASHLVLGREVKAGEVLVEIDANRERLEIEEEHNRLLEARQRLRAAEAAAWLAADHVDRTRRLYQKHLVAQTDFVRAKADSRGRDAEVAALSSSVAALTAAVARREEELARREIRAPVDGRIAGLTILDRGAVVREGEQLASIIPNGPVRAMAEFPPSAVGRVRSGQPARLRLDGFPWAQYGSIPATVASVGTEPREGRVRVEFIVNANGSSRIPIQHGLPGIAEVEVEKVSPAMLVLRAAGRWIVPTDSRANLTVTVTR